jgi:hypothetical protein
VSHFHVLIGAIARITSYLVLPFAKVCKPTWDYDAKMLAKDFIAHPVYGVTTGTIVAIAAKGVAGGRNQAAPFRLFGLNTTGGG